MNGLNAMKIAYDDNDRLHWTDALVAAAFVLATAGVIYGLYMLI